TFRVTGKTHIIVTSPVDDAHAIAALRILSSPDTLPVLVVGGDHLTEGLSAIQYALANPVLRPHYAFIEAKRLAEPFYQRQADPTAAASLIDRSTVLNEAEIRKAAKLTPKLKATLNYLVKKYDCSGHTRRAVSQSGE
ncbi:MAG: hypothetical protein JNN08_08050, partial [Bryobacterales bacterium]|nr:hypothetical protein [Bryobacterales bacterium]